jgi:hypothetical protein
MLKKTKLRAIARKSLALVFTEFLDMRFCEFRLFVSCSGLCNIEENVGLIFVMLQYAAGWCRPWYEKYRVQVKCTVIIWTYFETESHCQMDVGDLMSSMRIWKCFSYLCSLLSMLFLLCKISSHSLLFQQLHLQYRYNLHSPWHFFHSVISFSIVKAMMQIRLPNQMFLTSIGESCWSGMNGTFTNNPFSV